MRQGIPVTCGGVVFTRFWRLHLRAGGHPGLKGDLAEPVGGSGNAAEILEHVLLANEANGNLTAIAVDDTRAKDLLAEKDSFGVVPQCPVSNIS